MFLLLEPNFSYLKMFLFSLKEGGGFREKKERKEGKKRKLIRTVFQTACTVY